jgi:hypothetical protein
MSEEPPVDVPSDFPTFSDNDSTPNKAYNLGSWLKSRHQLSAESIETTHSGTT